MGDDRQRSLILGETESYKRDCFARYILKNWKRDRIQAWLDKNKGANEDMKARLNKEMESKRNG